MRNARKILAESTRSILENLENRRLLAGIEMDFGDAPDTYRTTLPVNGARHTPTPNLLLGSHVDGETDGLPSVNADRDDFSGPVDDEDGILFLDPIVPGTMVDVQVTNGAAAGFLNTWVDFNINGTFDAGEQVFTNLNLPAASMTIQTFLCPATATAGLSYARFRLSGTVAAAPTPFGDGGIGEVEDYRVAIMQAPTQLFDYGDAPDSYRTTLGVNGARHQASQNIRLGANVDAEPNGQPSISASRDDTTGVPDDEDGVLFLNPLVQGGIGTVQVSNGGGAARLNAWMDFNGDGIFGAGEQIFTNVPMALASVNVLNFPIPAASAAGTTYSRWRVNTAGGLTPFGLGGVGEVEDYQNRIDPAAPPTLDFGDAPNTFGTTLAVNGARAFATQNLRLGALVDAEADGQPTPLASGDDTNAADDEDGVIFLTNLVQGQNATVQVTNGAAAGRLNAWVDFNADGVFGAGEQIFTNLLLAAASVNVLNFFVPAASVPGNVFARFRLNAGGGVGPTGHGGTGEVEDYQTRIQAAPNAMIDFGDAPEVAGGPFQYPTLLAGISANPARHTIPGAGPILGNVIDGEADGQPNIPSTGDDIAGIDDEEGVTIGGVPLELVPLVLGSNVQIEVENGGTFSGLLNAWIDFNQNGTWQATEQVATNVNIPAGVTFLINVAIPATINPQGALYSRWRIATQGGLQPTGAASNGEVEDYRSSLRAPPPAQLLDFGDAPNTAAGGFLYPTLLGGPPGNPARHIIVTSGPRLGNRIDPELDGQPNLSASGDDVAGIDDEDGVFVGAAPLETVPLIPGNVLPVRVSNPTGMPGLVNAWFDWNSDGDWNDPGEQVATNIPAPPGMSLIPVNVPAGLSPNREIYSRFRINTAGGLAPVGLGNDGEVEDYVQRVIVDTLKPFVVAARLEFETSQSLYVEFSEDLDPATVQLTDIKAVGMTGNTFNPSGLNFVLGDGSVRFIFNTPTMILPDDNYSFVFDGNSGITDPSGNGLLLPAVLTGPDFFWKAGDATRDRKTDINDFSRLAANFNRPGTFSHGDFNYSGMTDIMDFSILASRFNTTLPSPRGVPTAVGLSLDSSAGPRFSTERIVEILEENDLSTIS